MTDDDCKVMRVPDLLTLTGVTAQGTHGMFSFSLPEPINVEQGDVLCIHFPSMVVTTFRPRLEILGLGLHTRGRYER